MTTPRLLKRGKICLVPTLRVGMQLPTLCVAINGIVGKTPTTRSVEDFIPTRCVGTRLAFAAGYEWIDTDRERYKTLNCGASYRLEPLILRMRHVVSRDPTTLRRGARFARPGAPLRKACGSRLTCFF